MNSITLFSNKNPSLVGELIYFYGNLTDAEGYPINEVSVYYKIGGDVIQQTYTDLNGRYGFQHLFTQAGNYLIQVCENPSWGVAYAKASLTQTVTTTTPTTMKLTIAVNNPSYGTTNPAPGTRNYATGTQVTVQALPGEGFDFDYWILDGGIQSNANPWIVTMDRNHSLVAYFSYTPPPPPPPGYWNIRIVAGIGGITEPVPGVYSYLAGSTVRVEAFPQIGYVFSRWKINNVLGGSEPQISVIMDRNILLQAIFTLAIPKWVIPAMLLTLGVAATGYGLLR